MLVYTPVKEQASHLVAKCWFVEQVCVHVHILGVTLGVTSLGG